MSKLRQEGDGDILRNNILLLQIFDVAYVEFRSPMIIPTIQHCYRTVLANDSKRRSLQRGCSFMSIRFFSIQHVSQNQVYTYVNILWNISNLLRAKLKKAFRIGWLPQQSHG
jgi:hypothetical protein